MVAAVIAVATGVRSADVAVSVVAVIPGARADKDAAYKVVRPVVSVRSTGVGIVGVITVGTHGRCGYVAIAIVVVIVIIAKKLPSHSSTIFP